MYSGERSTVVLRFFEIPVSVSFSENQNQVSATHPRIEAAPPRKAPYSCRRLLRARQRTTQPKARLLCPLWRSWRRRHVGPSWFLLARQRPSRHLLPYLPACPAAAAAVVGVGGFHPLHHRRAPSAPRDPPPWLDVSFQRGRHAGAVCRWVRHLACARM